MAAMEIVAATGGQDSTVPLPKRFKTSELPLSVSQRTSIDNLLHTIKKKGEFDALRKKIWSLYTDSVSTVLADFNRKAKSMITTGRENCIHSIVDRTS